METIKCKHCAKPIAETNVNRDEQVANCQNCNTMFYFGNTSSNYANYTKPNVTVLPSNIELIDNGSQLLFSITNKGFAKSFFTLFSIIWNLIVGIFVVVSLSTGNYKILLFMSIHLLIGFGVGYHALTLWINKPQLAVDKNYLLFNQGKLKHPFKRNFYIEVPNVKQLFCQKYSAGTVNNMPVFNFKVMVRTHEAEDKILIKGLPKYQHALFVEQQIERFLNIKDNAVDEEYNTH